MVKIENLLRMLQQGQDNPMLRFGLGKAYLDCGQTGEACDHLRACIDQAPDYSAAWKLLGRALMIEGQSQEARRTLEKGIEVARAKGDMQALREMEVFLRRLDKEEGARG